MYIRRWKDGKEDGDEESWYRNKEKKYITEKAIIVCALIIIVCALIIIVCEFFSN